MQHQQIAVIFDMDGVLVDSAAAHMQSWQMLASELGSSPISSEQFSAAFGRRSGDIISDWFGVHEPSSASRLDARKESLYRDLIRGRVPAMAGAVELVSRLHREGVRLAVGSSGPPDNVALVCREMGLDRYLSATVTGADVERGKPDPQVFLIAAQRLNVPPPLSVVIEDAPSGIEAARRAGMKSIGLTSHHPASALAGANRIVSQLDEISADIIRAL
jgi:beta-phosphoglucomutase